MWLSPLQIEHYVSLYWMLLVCIVNATLYSAPSLENVWNWNRNEAMFVLIRHPIRHPAMGWPDTRSGRIGQNRSDIRLNRIRVGYPAEPDQGRISDWTGSGPVGSWTGWRIIATKTLVPAIPSITNAYMVYSRECIVYTNCRQLRP